VDIVQVAAIAMAAGMRMDELVRVPRSYPTYAAVLARAALSTRDAQHTAVAPVARNSPRRRLMNHNVTAHAMHDAMGLGKRLGLVTFLAFLLKGLVWLGLFAAAWLSS
jgi:hypothetical protein